MSARIWTAAAVAALGLLGWGGGARADDVVRLKGGEDAPTITLEGKGDAETVAVRGGRGGRAGGVRGGVRAGGVRAGGVRAGGVRFGGVRAAGVRVGGVRAGGVRAGGVRAGGVRVGYGPRAAYGRRGPVVVGRGGWGWGGGWYGYPAYRYYPRYYSNYYYYPYPYPYPYAVEYPVPVTTNYYSGPTIVPEGTMPYAPAALTPAPVPDVVPGDGTYDYDGGPGESVPLPNLRPGPTSAPARSQAAPVRQVSLPQTQAPHFAYPAYGDPARPSTSAPDRTYLTGNLKAAR